MTIRNSTIAFALAGIVLSPAALAQQCRVARNATFPGDGETVRLARSTGLGPTANVGIFKAPLAVNTDGAPTSYHPHDFLGQSKAINRIDNGIAIRKLSGARASVPEKIEAFSQWIASPDWANPPGYRITWQNVIAANARQKPCVFQGDNAGYFGSLTALKNGLPPAQRGECEAADQLDLRYIPAIVLRGPGNPLTSYGAALGDLVLAINPASGVAVPAIIGDAGNGDRIGEGSVALNMALLGRTAQPANYAEARALDTGAAPIIVAVLPGSRAFNRMRPYSAANIEQRVENWARARGYGSTANLAAAISRCSEGL